MANKNKNRTIKVAGQTFKIGNKLGPGEIRKIAAATDKSAAQIINRASNAGFAASTAAQNYAASVTPGAQAMPGGYTDPGTDSGGYTDPGTDSGGGGGGGGTDDLINDPEYLAIQKAAELKNQSMISNYGWDAQKAMENIRQAAETERLKYEVDNRIPVVQAEAKGKIDLQKIVNAGLQNVTRIERGADMMRSITSMFNF